MSTPTFSHISNFGPELPGIICTKQHIHDKLIIEAKQKLSTTNQSISQIVYEIGFEHWQSFSKLFKCKTAVTPSQFRESFN
ncbi:MAG: hypothetical protein CMF36_06845 [Leeuwenhoekiella sp.]|nr:hypothetical protein [Leeuwenhoekiella sp.]MBA80835.1 hypothetical protein [Leeuwenhoekiella sp.]|tara:strand:+ start:18576 stop:18818 length:243 start_codon:yes stop_codon:yes gene_type:complete